MIPREQTLVFQAQWDLCFLPLSSFRMKKLNLFCGGEMFFVILSAAQGEREGSRPKPRYCFYPDTTVQFWPHNEICINRKHANFQKVQKKSQWHCFWNLHFTRTLIFEVLRMTMQMLEKIIAFSKPVTSILRPSATLHSSVTLDLCTEECRFMSKGLRESLWARDSWNALATKTLETG